MKKVQLSRIIFISSSSGILAGRQLEYDNAGDGKFHACMYRTWRNYI